MKIFTAHSTPVSPTQPLHDPSHPTPTPISIILNLGSGKSNIYYFPHLPHYNPPHPTPEWHTPPLHDTPPPLHDPPHPTPAWHTPSPPPLHDPLHPTPALHGPPHPTPTWPTPAWHTHPTPPYPTPHPPPHPGTILGRNWMDFMGSFTMSPFW